ncbi:MAG: hypothetical protein ABIR31_04240 [Ginsengibacter sp.]
MISKFGDLTISGLVTKIGIYLFAMPWLVIGLQHFIYAPFVQTLVPSLIPFKLFWVLLTGTAMIGAGLSLVLNLQMKMATRLLSTMLLIFIMLVHLPILTSSSSALINWIRATQDIGLMATALMLTGRKNIVNAGIIIFGFALAVQGFQHFLNPSFITACIPVYFPSPKLLNAIVAVLLIITGLCIITGRSRFLAAVLLAGLILILSLLNYLPLIISNVSYGQHWTGLFLDVGLAGGACISGGLAIKPTQTFPFEILKVNG